MRLRILFMLFLLLIIPLGKGTSTVTAADGCDIGLLCAIEIDVPNCTNGVHTDFQAAYGNWFLSVWTPDGLFIQGTDGKCTDTNGCGPIGEDIVPNGLNPPPPIGQVFLEWRMRTLDDLPYFYDAYCL